jgi:UDP-N-acetylglucosamine transferase subunit ALG13
MDVHANGNGTSRRANGNGGAPLVFVTVGTDHHRFERLMDWADAWGAAHPDVRLFVQHGNARAVEHAESSPFLRPEQFKALLATANAVVCPGGPGGIMETRAAGLRPIVVPRRAHLEEHVDDHQLAFSRFLAGRDLVTLAEEEPAFDAALDAVVTTPDAYAIPPTAGSPAGIEGVAHLIDDLVWGTR